MVLSGPTKITNDNIEVISPEGPVLLACIHHDDQLDNYLKTLNIVSRWFKEQLQICFAVDEMLPYFMDKYHFEGTPTYILLERGELKGCLRGQTLPEDLVTFIKKSRQGEL